MDNWITGLSLLKNILEIAMGNTNGSQQDVTRLVQDELRRSQSREHSEILRDILMAMEASSGRREEEMNLKAKVEELTQKLEKLDHEKKSSETRTWMKDLLEKMILAGAERRYQYKQDGRGRGRGRGGPHQSYRPNHDTRDYNDHLPWTDGPKGVQNNFQQRERDSRDSFVFVNRDDVHFNPRGGGTFHRGGFQRNRGQPHRSISHGQPKQDGENVPQQNNFRRGHNHNQQRGNYRGQGRGAIPKSSNTRTSSSDVSGNQGTDEIRQLTAKLMNLSTTSDVPLELTREEVLAIKNALKEKSMSENQQKGKPKKLENEQEQTKKNNNKKKNKQQAAPTQRAEDKAAPEKPSSEVVNTPPRTTPSQAPVQMLPLTDFSDSFLQLLPANQVLEAAMLVAKEGARVVTLQPRTVQEMRDFKSKYPSAELFALKPSDS